MAPLGQLASDNNNQPASDNTGPNSISRRSSPVLGACTVCGAIGADARPNWQERAPISLFGRQIIPQMRD